MLLHFNSNPTIIALNRKYHMKFTSKLEPKSQTHGIIKTTPPDLPKVIQQENEKQQL